MYLTMTDLSATRGHFMMVPVWQDIVDQVRMIMPSLVDRDVRVVGAPYSIRYDFVGADVGMAVVTQQDDLTANFEELAAQWHNDTQFISAPSEIYLHPSYLRIIGMGNAVVPKLLRKFESEPGFWVTALMAITGENPVPKESRGDFESVRQAWLAWGREKGLLN